jgi:hypothetical protein
LSRRIPDDLPGRASRKLAQGTAMDDATKAKELRFAKTQQWYVATAAVTLNAAVFALLKGSHLHGLEALAAISFVLLVAAAGVRVLCDLQDHMQSLREPNAPWHRPTDVVFLLMGVVIAVGAAVLYCLVFPLRAIP